MASGSEVNIKTFAEDIQGKIKDKIESILGKEKELRINVEVRKISFNKRENAFDEDLEDDIEGPFRKY